MDWQKRGFRLNGQENQYFVAIFIPILKSTGFTGIAGICPSYKGKRCAVVTGYSREPRVRLTLLSIPQNELGEPGRPEDTKGNARGNDRSDTGGHAGARMEAKCL